MKCYYCGSEIDKVEKCPACGHSQNLTEAEKKEEARVYSAQTAASKVKYENEELFKLCEGAMTAIYAVSGKSMSQGTGFYIKFHNEKFCITNHHVIGRSKYISVCFAPSVDPSHEKYAAEMIAADTLNDVAIIKLHADVGDEIKLPDRRYLKLIDDMREVKIGQEVCTVGNPRGLNGILSVGRVSGIGSGTSEYLSDMMSANSFLVNLTATHGNSGGAICNEYGEVIGIATAIHKQLPNQTICASAFAIKQLLLAYLSKNK